MYLCEIILREDRFNKTKLSTKSTKQMPRSKAFLCFCKTTLFLVKIWNYGMCVEKQYLLKHAISYGIGMIGSS